MLMREERRRRLAGSREGAAFVEVRGSQGLPIFPVRVGAERPFNERPSRDPDALGLLRSIRPAQASNRSGVSAGNGPSAPSSFSTQSESVDVAAKRNSAAIAPDSRIGCDGSGARPFSQPSGTQGALDEKGARFPHRATGAGRSHSINEDSTTTIPQPITLYQRKPMSDAKNRIATTD